MNLLRIVTNKELDPLFLFYCTKHEFNRSRFRSISQPAINQVSINAFQLKKIEIPVPPLQEQQKIASILSNVDNLI